jgi:hypothetical protein
MVGFLGVIFHFSFLRVRHYWLVTDTLRCDGTAVKFWLMKPAPRSHKIEVPLC